MDAKAWIDAWKAKAEQRRETLANLVTRKPVNPAVANYRDRVLKQYQTTVNNHKDWVQAYQQHIEEVAKIMTKRPSTARPSAVSSTKGGVGEA